MNFELTEMQADIREMAREFAEEHVAPIAAEIDREHRFPEENFALMAEQGFNGINIEEKYGGLELDEFCKCLVVEEISKKCGATGSILSVHTLHTYCVSKFANDEQKEKY
ncbi:MAG: acyl-CoA dehydrogenase family protein, partial [Firmicutes bacterium]|nr:acyl-CoA dehydrogenase family protein [Bacillota bacterium]